MAYAGEINMGDRFRLCVPFQEMVSVLVLEAMAGS